LNAQTGIFPVLIVTALPERRRWLAARASSIMFARGPARGTRSRSVRPRRLARRFALHPLENRTPFKGRTLEKITDLTRVYGHDLTAEDSRQLRRTL
jgi:hypothetical protein